MSCYYVFDGHIISHFYWIVQQVQNNWIILHKILTLIYVYARMVEDAHTMAKAMVVGVYLDEEVIVIKKLYCS